METQPSGLLLHRLESRCTGDLWRNREEFSAVQ